jgi:hypothetical protein
LTLQQNPKNPGLVRRFLHGHQVLNVPEGHHPHDPILWASILEDSNLLDLLGASICVVWIHEKHQLDILRLICVRPINFFHLLHLGNKRNVGFSRIEGGTAAKDLKNLLMAIVWIEILQQKCNRSAVC